MRPPAVLLVGRRLLPALRRTASSAPRLPPAHSLSFEERVQQVLRTPRKVPRIPAVRLPAEISEARQTSPVEARLLQVLASQPQPRSRAPRAAFALEAEELLARPRLGLPQQEPTRQEEQEQQQQQAEQAQRDEQQKAAEGLQHFYEELGVAAPEAPLPKDEIYEWVGCVVAVAMAANRLPQQSSKFINYIMQDGKKSVAKKLLDDTLMLIKLEGLATVREKYQQAVAAGTQLPSEEGFDPKQVFFTAINNVLPVMTLRPTRKGGSVFQVPSPLTQRHAYSLAMKWIIQAARSRQGFPFAERLAKELLDASNGEGKAVAKKIEQHKMCEANRAYVSMFAKR